MGAIEEQAALQVETLKRITALERAASAGGGGAGTWTAPTFEFNWVNYGGIYQVAQYRLDGDVVTIRGHVKNGSTNSILYPIFTLPVGHRPPATMTYWIHCYFTIVGSYYGMLRIEPTGEVWVTSSYNQGVLLNNISFSITA